MAQRLDQVLDFADAYFMGQSDLHTAARSLARLFDREGIPYAIAGAIALGVHGRRRLTEDVDVLIRREDLRRFKQQWLGRGYVEVTPGLKAVRDTVRGVKIDFLITGDYPGDGKPKPVSFPDPASLEPTGDDFRVLPLATLIEMKLASGQSAPHRGQDLVDVMELVRANDLPREFAGNLDESVRAAFDEQWRYAQVRDDY